MKYFSCNGAGSQSNRWVGQDLQDALPATKLSRLNMCQPANQTSDLSAGTELTPYVTQVGQHMFPMKSENVTATYHTFGGVLHGIAFTHRGLLEHDIPVLHLQISAAAPRISYSQAPKG